MSKEKLNEQGKRNPQEVSQEIADLFSLGKIDFNKKSDREKLRSEISEMSVEKPADKEKISSLKDLLKELDNLDTKQDKEIKNFLKEIETKEEKLSQEVKTNNPTKEMQENVGKIDKQLGELVSSGLEDANNRKKILDRISVVEKKSSLTKEQKDELSDFKKVVIEMAKIAPKKEAYKKQVKEVAGKQLSEVIPNRESDDRVKEQFLGVPEKNIEGLKTLPGIDGKNLTPETLRIIMERLDRIHDGVKGNANGQNEFRKLLKGKNFVYKGEKFSYPTIKKVLRRGMKMLGDTDASSIGEAFKKYIEGDAGQNDRLTRQAAADYVMGRMHDRDPSLVSVIVGARTARRYEKVDRKTMTGKQRREDRKFGQTVQDGIKSEVNRDRATVYDKEEYLNLSRKETRQFFNERKKFRTQKAMRLLIADRINAQNEDYNPTLIKGEVKENDTYNTLNKINVESLLQIRDKLLKYKTKKLNELKRKLLKEKVDKSEVDELAEKEWLDFMRRKDQRKNMKDVLKSYNYQHRGVRLNQSEVDAVIDLLSNKDAIKAISDIRIKNGKSKDYLNAYNSQLEAKKVYQGHNNTIKLLQRKEILEKFKKDNPTKAEEVKAELEDINQQLKEKNVRSVLLERKKEIEDLIKKDSTVAEQYKEELAEIEQKLKETYKEGGDVLALLSNYDPAGVFVKRRWQFLGGPKARLREDMKQIDDRDKGIQASQAILDKMQQVEKVHGEHVLVKNVLTVMKSARKHIKDGVDDPLTRFDNEFKDSYPNPEQRYSKINLLRFITAHPQFRGAFGEGLAKAGNAWTDVLELGSDGMKNYIKAKKESQEISKKSFEIIKKELEKRVDRVVGKQFDERMAELLRYKEDELNRTKDPKDKERIRQEMKKMKEFASIGKRTLVLKVVEGIYGGYMDEILQHSNYTIEQQKRVLEFVEKGKTQRFGAGIAGSLQSESFNAWLERKTEGILKYIKLGYGVGGGASKSSGSTEYFQNRPLEPLEQPRQNISSSSGWKAQPLVALTLAFGGDQKIAEKLKRDYSAGAAIALGAIIPLPTYFVSTGFTFEKMNEQRIKEKVSFDEFQKGSHSLRLGGHVALAKSMLPVWGVSMSYYSDKLEGVDIKAKQFEQVVKDLVTKGSAKNIPKNDQQYVQDLKEKIQTFKDTYGYKDLNSQEKKMFEKHMTDSFVQLWKTQVLLNLDKKIYISGGSIGLNFVAGVMPLPTVTMKLTKIETAWKTNRESVREANQRIDTGAGSRELHMTTRRLQENAVVLHEKLSARMNLKDPESLSIEPTSDGKLVITGEALERLSLFVSPDPAIAKNVYYEHGRLVVGDVGLLTIAVMNDQKSKDEKLFIGCKGKMTDKGMALDVRKEIQKEQEDENYQSPLANAETEVSSVKYEINQTELNKVFDTFKNKEIGKKVRTEYFEMSGDKVLGIKEKSDVTYAGFTKIPGKKYFEMPIEGTITIKEINGKKTVEYTDTPKQKIDLKYFYEMKGEKEIKEEVNIQTLLTKEDVQNRVAESVSDAVKNDKEIKEITAEFNKREFLEDIGRKRSDAGGSFRANYGVFLTETMAHRYENAKNTMLKMIPAGSINDKVKNITDAKELSYLSHLYMDALACGYNTMQKWDEKLDGKSSRLERAKYYLDSVATTMPGLAPHRTMIEKAVENNQWQSGEWEKVFPFFKNIPGLYSTINSANDPRKKLFDMICPVKRHFEGRKNNFNTYVNSTLDSTLRTSVMDYRQKLTDQIPEQVIGYQLESRPSMIGYNSYYRLRNTGINTGMAMMPLGAVEVAKIGDKPQEVDIPKTDTALYNYFFETKINQVPGQREAMKFYMTRMIEKALKTKNIVIDTTKDNIDKIIENNYSDLIQGKEITFVVGSKDVHIALDTAMKMFLYGNCMNEGIGLEFKGIKIRTKQETVDRQTDGGSASEIITYLPLGLFENNAGTTAQIQTRKVDLNIGGGFGRTVTRSQSGSDISVNDTPTQGQGGGGSGTSGSDSETASDDPPETGGGI